MKEEELEQELENNKADLAFPTNEGYVKVESIERVHDVIISKSLRFSKIIERSELKGETFKAEITIKDNVTLILLLAEEEKEQGEKTQTVPATPFFSVPLSSLKQRIKYKGWEAVGKSRIGIIYKEVINRVLEEYTEDGTEPTTEILSQAIQEMHGKELKPNTLASYVCVYKRYIRENKLAEKPPITEQKENNLDIPKSIVKPSQKGYNSKEYNPKGKYLLPIKKVIEIWDLLPDEFEYKQVKALVPAYIMQSGPRSDTAKFIIKQFLEIAEFGCEKTSEGVFKKVR